MEQLRRVLGALWVEELSVDLTVWGPQALPVARDQSMPLALGVPLVELDKPLPLSLRATPSPGETPVDPVARSFETLMADVQRAVSDVRQAAVRREPAPTQRSANLPQRLASLPRETRQVVSLSVHSHPTLLDHSLIPQPVGWQNVSDRNPVVPMTMMLELMREAAVAAGGGVAVGLRNVRARKWLSVHPAVDVSVITTRLSDELYRVVLEGYAEGE